MEQYQQRLTYLPTYLLTYLLTWQDYKRGMLSSSGPGHASTVSLTSMLVYGSIVKYASFILAQHTTETIAAVCLLLDFLDFFATSVFVSVVSCWVGYYYYYTRSKTLFPGTTRVSRYQKCKTNVDFTKARDSEWQWH